MKTKIYEYLKKYFGYDEFRPGQYDIIENIVSGNSALAIMPTGGGKSLCYQIPALIFEGITIVVSPLISLMKDQVDKLKERNIPVALINSTLSNSEVLETINEVRNNRIKILYVAPERFNSKLFFDDLNGVKVSFFAVDEAHCISQWGHDFRPSYLRLRRAVEHLGNPVVAGFTATATHEVRLDIIKNLGMFNPKVVIRGFDRPNIKYLTLLLKENEKKEELVRVINKFRVTTIVYCSTKKTTLLVADYLNKHKITCGVYHGSMDGDARHLIQDRFFENKLPVVVATNAFGMGIDKPDIRLLVHYNMPGSVEAFYQETGRAGRDGKTSYSLLMGNRQDIAIQKYLINSSFPTKETIREVYDILLTFNENPVLKTYKEIAEQFSKKINEMAVGSVIKILESGGIIRRLQEKNHPASIMFYTDIERVLQRNRIFAARRKIIQYFIDKLPEKELHKVFSFSIEDLLKKTGMSRENFVRNIKKIAETNDIHYSSPFSGKGIEVLSVFNEKDELPLDFAKIEENRNRHMQKVDEVNDFIVTRNCKRKYLLNYFGENYDKPACGGCDICLGWRRAIIQPKIMEKEPVVKATKQVYNENSPIQKTLQKPASGISEKEIKIFYCCLLKYNNKIGLQKFFKLLKGSKEASLAKIGLDRCPFYGKLKEFSEEAITSLYKKEKKAGYVGKTKSRLFPKVILTEPGKERAKSIIASN